MIKNCVIIKAMKKIIQQLEQFQKNLKAYRALEKDYLELIQLLIKEVSILKKKIKKDKKECII